MGCSLMWTVVDGTNASDVIIADGGERVRCMCEWWEVESQREGGKFQKTLLERLNESPNVKSNQKAQVRMS